MKEQVIAFGKDNNLVGVLTEPDPAIQRQETPTLLILNSGILHHTGPFRLHVTTARHLAEQGYSVLRFDIAGIGDSPLMRGAEYDEQGVIADVQAAMDGLAAKKGKNKFVLMGLCTGAANAHNAAVADSRVIGGIFLDGYAYPTWRFYLNRYAPLLLSPSRLANSITKRIGFLIPGKTDAPNSSEPDQNDFGWWTLPPKSQMKKDLQTLIDRDVNLFYIYAGDRHETYNYEAQLEQAFSSINFNGKLHVVINQAADHTYIMTRDREKLTDQISHWLKEWYPH